MALFIWSPNLNTGIAEVDKDHRALVNLINMIHGYTSDGKNIPIIETVLDTLIDYTRYHFAREEKALVKAGYIDIGCHKVQHYGFTAKVLQLRRQLAIEGSEFDVQSIVHLTSDWLMEHILKEDMKFVKALSSANKTEMGRHMMQSTLKAPSEPNLKSH